MINTDTISADKQVNSKELIARLPKSEIHVHIEGVASLNTLWRLMRKYDLKLGIDSKEDLEKRFEIHTLSEFVDLYINVIQVCFRNAEDIDLLIDDVSDYMKNNNIRYAEIFFSPTKLIMNGIPYGALAERLTRGYERLKRENLKARFIIDLSRSYGIENARQNLLYHFKHPSKAIIAVGLGGAERKCTARDFRKVFEVAINNGLHAVAHAGEDLESYAIWDTVRYLKVQRIGHGISAYKDETLMRYLREQQIPLEVCPTSNLYTARFASSIETHPLRVLYDNNLCVTINSDDPTIFATELNLEYIKLLDSGLCTIDEIIKMIKNGIYATFMTEAEKDALWAEARECIVEHGYAETLEQFG